jgi:hypothetical protein
MVDLMKVIPSHRVMLKGEDDQMATPLVFGRSQEGEGQLPFLLAPVHDG